MFLRRSLERSRQLNSYCLHILSPMALYSTWGGPWGSWSLGQSQHGFHSIHCTLILPPGSLMFWGMSANPATAGPLGLSRLWTHMAIRDIVNITGECNGTIWVIIMMKALMCLNHRSFHAKHM